ncbi:MAG: DNA-processing protein DprA [Trueperella sp.]|nr:DNA-processing protein DprA [Trueperella sp.]
MTELTPAHLAAAHWTRLVEGGDTVAWELIQRLGYQEALTASQTGVGLSPAEKQQAQRWQQRAENLRPLTAQMIAAMKLQLLIPGDEFWPAQLTDLGADCPLALWVRGEVRALARPMLAIVGSRDASSYGQDIARDIAYELANYFTIVSGGAFGIDAAAHRGALLADQATVIVSAGGADRVYPRAHQQLFTDVIAHGGAVVSENPPNAAPQRFRFLLRNRIIAALAGTTVVVEAPFRSGALSTARHALALGRNVGAFPGRVDSPRSVGCHELLRNSATLVTNSAQVSELAFPIGMAPESAAAQLTIPDFFTGAGAADFDPKQQRVFDAVPVRRAAELAKIAQLAALSIPETMSALGALKFAGKVVESGSGWVKADTG